MYMSLLESANGDWSLTLYAVFPAISTAVSPAFANLFTQPVMEVKRLLRFQEVEKGLYDRPRVKK